MTIDSATSFTPTLPVDLLSNGTGLSGATQPEKLKAACKAIEGLFAGQLLSEIGKGLDTDKSDPASGQYQDFIQQALAQQVTSGGGFGLAKMLETSLTPATHPQPNAPHLHAPTTSPASS
jgi:Rod binding domain-containing protein